MVSRLCFIVAHIGILPLTEEDHNVDLPYDSDNLRGKLFRFN